MLKRMSFVSFLTLIALTAWSQVVPVSSYNCGGSSMDMITNGCYGIEGRYAFMGMTYSSNHDIPSNHGASDAWLFIKNADGSTFISKTFDGTQDDHGIDIVQRSDSMYVFVINSNSAGTADFPVNLGGYDIWLKAVTQDTMFSAGLQLAGTDNDYARDLALTVNGGYVIAGTTYSADSIFQPNSGSSDGFLLRVSPSGTLLWVRTVGNAMDNSLQKVVCLPDGSFMTVGYSEGGGNHLLDVHAFSSTGSGLDSKHYSGDSTIIPLALAFLDSNSFYTGGFTSATQMDFWQNTDMGAGFIVRFRGNTDPDTMVFISGTGMEMVTDIIPYNDSLLLVTIVSTSTGGIFTGNHGSSDVYVAVMDENLNNLGIWPFGGSMMDGVFEFGQTSSFLNPSGNMVIGSCSESSNGHLPGNYGMLDGWVLEFDPSDLFTSVHTIPEENISIYPNPASGYIHVLLPGFSTCVIELMGIDGKVMQSWQHCGNINRLETSGVSSGLYFLRITHPSGSIVRKIVIQ